MAAAAAVQPSTSLYGGYRASEKGRDRREQMRIDRNAFDLFYSPCVVILRRGAATEQQGPRLCGY